MPSNNFRTYQRNEPVRWSFRTTYEMFHDTEREVYLEAGRCFRGLNDLEQTLTQMVMTDQHIPRILAYAWRDFNLSPEGLAVYPGCRHCSGMMAGLLLLVAARHGSLGEFASLRDSRGIAFEHYANHSDMTYVLGIEVAQRAIVDFGAYRQDPLPYVPLEDRATPEDRTMAQVVVEVMATLPPAQKVPEVPLSPEHRTVRLGKRISVVSQEQPSKAESPRRLKLRRDRDN